MAKVWDLILNPGKIWGLGPSFLLWILFILIVFMAFKTGKVYLNSIGKGEVGGREFFGIAAWMVLFGPGISVKGITTVRRAPKTPTRIDLASQVSVKEKVFAYTMTVTIVVSKGWAPLKKALYNFVDEDKGDLENAERTAQAKACLEAAARCFFETNDGKEMTLAGLRSTQIEYTDPVTHEPYMLQLDKVFEVYFGMVVTSARVTQFTYTEAQVIAEAIAKRTEIDPDTDTAGPSTDTAGPSTDTVVVPLLSKRGEENPA